MRPIITLLLALFFSVILYSQSAVKVTRADIEKEKKVYITEELELTQTEANAFWILYEAYEKELKQLSIKQRKIKKAMKNSEVLSEEEQYKLTKQYLTIEKEKAEVKLNYLNQFSSKIGKKKAAAVFKAEDEFKRELFKKLKKLPPPPNPPRPPSE